MLRTLTVLLLLAGCKRGATSDETGLTGGLTSPETPRADAAYYDPTRVVSVTIDMDPADFEELRGQTRDIMEVIGGDCLAEPAPNPYTWFHGDVTIDGHTVRDVGIRKKGFIGSLSWDKPGLRIEFDEWDDNQTLAGMERMTFNNNVQDPAVIRQCLGYHVFGLAGVPAPRCNFAKVTVNDEYLGVYTNVEPIKKEFLRQHFADDDGHLYEGTLSDFRDDWMGTFDAKTDDTDPNAAPLAAITDALGLGEADLVDALSPLVDLEQFRRFWATEVLIGHWDGYAGNTNNYFVYIDPTDGLARFIPWGIDGIMRDIPAFGDNPSSVLAVGYLPYRLYEHPDQRSLYLDTLKEVRDAAWDEDDLLAEIARMRALIKPHLLEPDWTLDNIAQVENFVEGRREDLNNELPFGGEWPWGPRGSPCLIDRGPIVVNFEGTWGSLETEDPFMSGNGDIVADFGSEHIEVTGGCVVGDYYESQGLLAVSALDGTILHQAVALFPKSAQAGVDYSLDLFVGETFGVLNWMDLAWMEEPITRAYITDGVLRFDEIAPVTGSPVRGSFEARLLGGPE